MASTIEKRPFTNEAFGFPRGKRRRVKPVALACIHITGNNRTGRMDEEDPGSGCRAEWRFANRAGSNGPSAHLYVARDGSAIEAINPARFAAWSNGDVTNPSTDNPGVARAVGFRHKGYNTNEAYWEEIECVGGSKFPLTAAQIETCARRIARRSRLTGLPINRQTVHGHWEINGIDRQNCPAPKAIHEKRLHAIVVRAREIAAALDAQDQATKASAAGGGGQLPFGAERRFGGQYVVVVDVARQRSSPFVRGDNIVRRVRRGESFNVEITTDRGSRVQGSSRWFGNAKGTVWMHDSVVQLRK